MTKALYRAFRPQTFDDVIDQDPITRVLKNQVKSQETSHAYLFSGGRGTGKTSCAKILARAVNCLHPVDGNPCNECDNCKMILEETSMDVVEMDAASNRRIDDIRELRDKVKYPPSTLKYKVYIVDEAHMITNEGFNALLKIMEEPPSYLIFILATTEIEKIPATILSRTQRFDFMKISQEAIEGHLAKIASEIDLIIDPEALHTMALVADGAMRDALSLLDQLRATGEKHIDQKLLDSFLGTAGQFLEEMTDYLFQNNLSQALLLSQDLLDEGQDPKRVVKEWIAYFRSLLFLKGTEGQTNMDHLEKEIFQKRWQQASQVSMERIVTSLDLMLEYDLKMKTSNLSASLFQILISKLASFTPKEDLLLRISALEEKVEALLNGQVVTTKPIERQEVHNIHPEKKEEKDQEITTKKEEIKNQEQEVKNREEDTKEKKDVKLTKEGEKNQDPISQYFSENKASICQKVQENGLVPAPIMNMCLCMRKRGNQYVLLFSEKSMAAHAYVGGKLKELEKLFSEMMGKELQLSLGVFEQEDFDQVLKEEKDRDEKIIRDLEETFPKDILKII